MTVLQQSVDELKVAIAGCPSCGASRFKKHGLTLNGKQRWQCSNCRRSSVNFSVDPIRRAGIRLDSAKVINLLTSIGRGLTIRSSARLCEVNATTACAILKKIGYVRQCRKCGATLTGNRFAFCSDECQDWIVRRGVERDARRQVLAEDRARRERLNTGSSVTFDGPGNVLSYVESVGCSPHVRLAIELASEISEQNMDFYLGPIYEGIELGHRAGIEDVRVLRRYGRDAVKQHWRQIQDYRTRSLDAMKEDTNFEPYDFDDLISAIE